MIDFRSDTFTLPTETMRNLIANAALGDDVFKEDPTVNKLESIAANIMGKESAILVPSGTMGNLASLLAHCSRGTEVILGNRSHTFLYEAGGISAFGGIHSRQLHNNDDGTIALDDIKSAVRSCDDHYPQTSTISLENTHNMCFGAPLELDYVKAVSMIAKDNELKLHIDGARIFNAAVSLGVDVKEIANYSDSITFCLSKGLGSPIGSVICGSNDFIHKVRKIRKALGGGMRQAGIIAASGIYSLENAIEQIKKDHNNAKYLAEELSQIDRIKIDYKKVKPNILYFEILSGNISDSQLISAMKEKGVLFFNISPGVFRMVTHNGISVKDIDITIKQFSSIFGE